MYGAASTTPREERLKDVGVSAESYDTESLVAPSVENTVSQGVLPSAPAHYACVQP